MFHNHVMHKPLLASHGYEHLAVKDKKFVPAWTEQNIISIELTVWLVIG